MNKPTISIIIPIYNVAPYIIECLESVYAQSYPNIEVIFCHNSCIFYAETIPLFAIDIVRSNYHHAIFDILKP